MQFNLQIRGAQEINARIEALKRNIPDIIEQSVKDDGNIIKAESRIEVPVDTTALRESSYVESVKTSNKITVEIGYGGPYAKINPKTNKSSDTYSIKVHEDLQMNHPRGGKAKFLEDPFKRHASNIFRHIMAAINRAMRGL